MVKFLKPNKAVVLLQERFAGHKTTIVKNFDDGTRDRPYGHCLIAGVAKYPGKVIRKDSAKKQASLFFGRRCHQGFRPQYTALSNFIILATVLGEQHGS